MASPDPLLKRLDLGNGVSGGYTISDPKTKALASEALERVPEIFDACTEDQKDKANECYQAQTGDPNSKIWRGDENLGAEGEDHKETLDLKEAKLDCFSKSGCVGDNFTAFFITLKSFMEEDLVPRLLAEIGRTEMGGSCGEVLTDIHQKRSFVYRLANYPEGQDGGHGAGQRCGSHTDQSTISINLMQSQPGLEVKVGGEWRPVPVGDPVVMVGEMLCLLSNGVLKPHEHRVVDAPAAEDGRIPRRVSLVVFVDMDADKVVKPCVQPGGAPRCKNEEELTAKEIKGLLYHKKKSIEDFCPDDVRAE